MLFLSTLLQELSLHDHICEVPLQNLYIQPLHFNFLHASSFCHSCQVNLPKFLKFLTLMITIALYMPKILVDQTCQN